MAACEKCWRDASLRAMLLGGSVVDHYNDLLAERAGKPCEPEPFADLTEDDMRAMRDAYEGRTDHTRKVSKSDTLSECVVHPTYVATIYGTPAVHKIDANCPICRGWQPGEV